MRLNICQRHLRLFEKLGEAIRPFAKEPYECEDRTCELSSSELDGLITDMVRIWRARTRLGIFVKEQPRTARGKR